MADHDAMIAQLEGMRGKGKKAPAKKTGGKRESAKAVMTGKGKVGIAGNPAAVQETKEDVEEANAGGGQGKGPEECPTCGHHNPAGTIAHRLANLKAKAEIAQALAEEARRAAEAIEASNAAVRANRDKVLGEWSKGLHAQGEKNREAYRNYVPPKRAEPESESDSDEEGPKSESDEEPPPKPAPKVKAKAAPKAKAKAEPKAAPKAESPKAAPKVKALDLATLLKGKGKKLVFSLPLEREAPSIGSHSKTEAWFDLYREKARIEEDTTAFTGGILAHCVMRNSRDILEAIESKRGRILRNAVWLVGWKPEIWDRWRDKDNVDVFSEIVDADTLNIYHCQGITKPGAPKAQGRGNPATTTVIKGWAGASPTGLSGSSHEGGGRGIMMRVEGRVIEIQALNSARSVVGIAPLKLDGRAGSTADISPTYDIPEPPADWFAEFNAISVGDKVRCHTKATPKKTMVMADVIGKTGKDESLTVEVSFGGEQAVLKPCPDYHMNAAKGLDHTDTDAKVYLKGQVKTKDKFGYQASVMVFKADMDPGSPAVRQESDGVSEADFKAEVSGRERAKPVDDKALVAMVADWMEAHIQEISDGEQKLHTNDISEELAEQIDYATHNWQGREQDKVLDRIHIQGDYAEKGRPTPREEWIVLRDGGIFISAVEDYGRKMNPLRVKYRIGEFRKHRG